ncbi:carboxypeptidase-like regulatory domain-containing protein [Pseudotenacibaculum sp. MALMAid0570]|uniref:carboxypeptidase-like regulatory domain-containing protein n=1 Tax=Pseudotenacibaculum sp. MALMAid0570 TaxID=3143938 RepID=UPI0032DEE376
MKFEIKIPKPCHEDWNKMSPTEKGKFCASCKKVVVDFTQMTDQQLVNKIQNNSNLCGRFKKEQLDKELAVNSASNFSKVAASVALVAMLGNSELAYSQGAPVKVEKVQLKPNANTSKSLIKKDSLVIEGNVADISGGLPGVAIILKGTTIGVETDLDGNFIFKINKKIHKNDTLVFSYLGFKTEEVRLDSIKRGKKFNLIMKEDETVLGGVVGFVVVEKKPNIFKRIGNLFKRKNKNRVKKND